MQQYSSSAVVHLLIAGLEEVEEHSTGNKKHYMPLLIHFYVTFVIENSFV
jgi:hypothetical protein